MRTDRDNGGQLIGWQIADMVMTGWHNDLARYAGATTDRDAARRNSLSVAAASRRR